MSDAVSDFADAWRALTDAGVSIHPSVTPSVASGIRVLAAQCLELRERVAFLESREVCTVAHDNVETCGYCQRDALAARLAAMQQSMDEVRPFTDKIVARLASLESQLSAHDALASVGIDSKGALAEVCKEMAGRSLAAEARLAEAEKQRDDALALLTKVSLRKSCEGTQPYICHGLATARARLAEAEQEYQDARVVREQLEARLAEVERLLGECRVDYERDFMAVGHNDRSKDRTQSMHYLKRRIETIDAFLRPADSAPAEPLCESCKGYGTRLRPGVLDDADPCPECKGTGLTTGSAPAVLDPDEIVNAQHDETGRMWQGKRKNIPRRFYEVSAGSAPADWQCTCGQFMSDNFDRCSNCRGLRTWTQVATSTVTVKHE